MALETFLADLRRRGVELAVDGANLRFRAPKGVLTAADRAALADRKGEILAALRREPVTAVTAPSRRPDRPGRPTATKTRSAAPGPPGGGARRSTPGPARASAPDPEYPPRRS